MNYRTAYDIFTNEPEFEALPPVSRADRLVAEDAERKSIHPHDADGSGGGERVGKGYGHPDSQR